MQGHQNDPGLECLSSEKRLEELGLFWRREGFVEAAHTHGGLCCCSELLCSATGYTMVLEGFTSAQAPSHCVLHCLAPLPRPSGVLNPVKDSLPMTSGLGCAASPVWCQQNRA